MKVWAEHQRSTGENIIKCPLCRVDVGSFQVRKKMVQAVFLLYFTIVLYNCTSVFLELISQIMLLFVGVDG